MVVDMENRGRAAAASIFVLAVVGACGGGDHIVAPVPSSLAITSGNNQRVAPGAALPEALEVSVTNSEGDGIAGVNVNWVVTAGDGTLSATRTITDSDGRASVGWTLGSRAGPQSVEAIVVAVASPALFSATAAARR
jgi:hypothetical protein